MLYYRHLFCHHRDYIQERTTRQRDSHRGAPRSRALYIYPSVFMRYRSRCTPEFFTYEAHSSVFSLLLLSNELQHPKRRSNDGQHPPDPSHSQASKPISCFRPFRPSRMPALSALSAPVHQQQYFDAVCRLSIQSQHRPGGSHSGPLIMNRGVSSNAWQQQQHEQQHQHQQQVSESIVLIALPVVRTLFLVSSSGTLITCITFSARQ